MVLYSSDLAASLSRVRDAGGTITEDMFGFPGWQRFELADPSGNVSAVWTKIEDTDIVYIEKIITAWTTTN